MALKNRDAEILEQIVVLEGNCLNGAERCQECPFRALCLPEFLNPTPPTRSQRLDLALRVLIHNEVMNCDTVFDDMKREFDKTARA